MQIHKKNHRIGGFFLILLKALCRNNRFNRATVNANATVGTSTGINNVDVAGGDAVNRTFTHTTATSSAIFSDFVSHDLVFF